MPIPSNTKLEMKKALRLINQSKRIFLTTHEGTDGDDLGSALALRQVLQKSGKEVFAAVKKGVPDSLAFLPGAAQVAGELRDLNFDLVATFGCNSVARTALELLEKFEGPIINFDHHPDNRLFGTINIVEPSTSSVAELMFHFFEICGLPIDQETATCLLTGVVTDTGGFKHANTTSETFHTASELVKKGARLDKISQKVRSSNRPSSLRIWSRALENTRFDPGKQMIYAVITKEDFEETNAREEDLSGFVNFLISIPQARYALLLRQDGDVVRGSLRSESDRNTDVNKIAASFGGGGHKLASGFKVKGKLVRMGRGWKILPL